MLELFQYTKTEVCYNSKMVTFSSLAIVSRFDRFFPGPDRDGYGLCGLGYANQCQGQRGVSTKAFQYLYVPLFSVC